VFGPVSANPELATLATLKTVFPNLSVDSVPGKGRVRRRALRRCETITDNAEIETSWSRTPFAAGSRFFRFCGKYRLPTGQYLTRINGFTTYVRDGP
jgi:hypothetical protein